MKRLLLLIIPLCFSFNVISQNFTQLGLDINGIFNEDKSGHSVDMDSIGNRIIIGSPENDNNGFNSGNTSVLEWDGINWNQLGSIIFGEGQNQADGDQSGFSVSINAAGDIIAIGAPLAMSFSPNWGWVSSGHVRVFKWRVYTQADENNQLYHYSSYSQNSNQPKPLIITQNTSVSPVVGNHYWCQLGNDINGEYFGDEFGFSLDLNSSGNILAVGSKMGCSNLTGCSYIFQWDGSSWGQLGQTITGINYHDYFGSSISLNALGNRVVVGSPGSDDFSNGNLEDEKGISRVYDWNGFSWVQLGQDIFGESDNDHSGHSVAISSSGNIIAIGSPFAGSQMNCYQGHVRIFELLGSSWIQLGQTIEGDTCVDVCGWSVSLSSDGNTVIIGSPEHETSAGSYTGHSRVFNLVNSNWSQYGSNINGQVTLDFSGYSVALNSSGNRSIIGSPSYFNPGHTRVFENNGCNLGTNEICLVSVDSTSSKNLVVWEKPISESIDSFFVYRDVVGTYTKIGAVPYDSLSQFIDTTNGVNPNTTSYRYKLSVLDSCGIESVLSDFHETIHLTVSSAGGNDKNLIWDNYEGFSFVYYRIWRDDIGNGNWNVLDSVTSSNTTYTDITSPSPNSNYFIEVIPAVPCVSTRAVSHNTTRSNRQSSGIFTGLEESPFITLGVYPNPTNGMLTVKGTMTSETTYRMYISDMSGRRVMEFPANKGRYLFNEINLNNLEGGLYFLTIQGEDFERTVRVVKQ